MTGDRDWACLACGEDVRAQLRGRPDARYCSDACKQKAYRARKQASADMPAVVGTWFTWYPPDIRELLLAGRSDPASWSRWLVMEAEGGTVNLRGGPDGWYRCKYRLAGFLAEATAVAP